MVEGQVRVYCGWNKGENLNSALKYTVVGSTTI